MYPGELPDEIATALREVALHHWDRDDAPVFFLWKYLADRALDVPPEVRRRFDEAVHRLEGNCRSMTEEALEALVQTPYARMQRFISPELFERLDALELAERAARLGAVQEVQRVCNEIVRAAILLKGISPGSRLHREYPALAARLTPRDQLLPVEGPVEPECSWVNYRGHSLHLHAGLRRAFSGSVNRMLTRMLWRQRDAGLELGVAVDSSRLCPRGELQEIIELDRWFGAPLDLARLDDHRDTGATVHGRSLPLGPFRDDEAGLLTEFRRTFRDGLKTFEIEELPAPSGNESGPVVVRYVHAIRDIHRRCFTHVDGALHVYTAASYASRYEQAQNHRLNKVWAEDKIKLFRLDAPLKGAGMSDGPWMEIVVEFFRGNELVLEYLSGKSFNDIYRETYGHDHPWIARASRPS